LTEADLPGADELRQLVGWNQRMEDWRRFLQMDPRGNFVLAIDDRIVGTVTTLTYGPQLAWIGMMLVHPDHRRQGIGRCLMGRALEYLQGRGVSCIRLDATPAGFPLYQQLGFITEWTLTRWERPADAEPVLSADPTDVPRPLAEADWASVERLDAEAFGVSRGALLRRLVDQNQETLVWPREGPVTGWGLLRSGSRMDYLGPLLCLNSRCSSALVAALLRNAEGRSVYWDVPDDHGEAKATAQCFGFAPIRPLTRMRLGPPIVPSHPRAQFAIADPAVG
jgi:predicted N-acetyltransferase YhbS